MKFNCFITDQPRLLGWKGKNKEG